MSPLVLNSLRKHAARNSHVCELMSLSYEAQVPQVDVSELANVSLGHVYILADLVVMGEFSSATEVYVPMTQ